MTLNLSTCACPFATRGFQTLFFLLWNRVWDSLLCSGLLLWPLRHLQQRRGGGERRLCLVSHLMLLPSHRHGSVQVLSENRRRITPVCEIRSGAREKYGIEGEECEDWLLSCCFTACVVCQTAAEHEERGEAGRNWDDFLCQTLHVFIFLFCVDLRNSINIFVLQPVLCLIISFTSYWNEHLISTYKIRNSILMQ